MKLEHNRPIYVAGHRGLVGSAIWRELQRAGFTHLIGRTHAELDLLDATAVNRFYVETKPQFVFVAAAKVGGILANDTRPAQFLYENLQIQNNPYLASQVRLDVGRIYSGQRQLQPEFLGGIVKNS